MADVTSKTAMGAAKRALKRHTEKAKRLQAKRGKKTAFYGGKEDKDAEMKERTRSSDPQSGAIPKTEATERMAAKAAEADAEKKRKAAKPAPKYSKRAKPEA
tara:strand:- start:1533 stop:1838 length:306 start_codon:yes stop_codon:yes gene_type:complete